MITLLGLALAGFYVFSQKRWGSRLMAVRWRLVVFWQTVNGTDITAGHLIVFAG